MKPVISDIPGIGPAAAETLGEHRIKSLASLANASIERIAAIPGFSEARATKVIAAAAELLAASGTAQPATEAAVKKDKAAGKGKKDKKDKKKGKGKDKKKDKKKGKGKKKGKK